MRALASAPLTLAILFLALLQCPAAPAPLFTCSGPAHSLQVQANGAYAVAFPNASRLSLLNGTIAVHQAGQWYSASSGSLALQSAATSSGTDALLGSFTAATLAYDAVGAAPALPVVAVFRCYAAGPLVFELAFPAGASNVSTEAAGQPQRSSRRSRRRRAAAAAAAGAAPEFDASLQPSSYFPAFAAAPLQASDVGYIEWNGRFTNDVSQYGAALARFVGGATGGPLVLFDAARPGATAAVLGTFDHFKSTMLALVSDPGSQPGPAPPPSACAPAHAATDVSGAAGCTPAGLAVPSQAACCAACLADACCEAYVYDTAGLMPPGPGENCWPVRRVAGLKPAANRSVGWARAPAPALLAAGVQGKVVNVPQGFTTKTALVSSALGVTDAVYAFGGALQAAYHTAARRPPPQESPLTSRLSYWTDNGAYFSCAFWRSWRPGNATAAQVLRELRAWHASQGLVFGSYQLDPWWSEDSDGGTDCGFAVDWKAKPALFPDGLEALGGLPLTLYMNYFAPLALGNRMTQYPWVDSVRIDVGWFEGVISQVAPASALAFFTDIMSRGVGWGMNAFEVDFLDFAGLAFPHFLNDTSSYTTWLQGMNDAALALNLSVQLCMDLPSDALLSVQMPRLNNARASEDDFPGADGRWDVSLSSLLYGALGLRPFYDDTWTVQSSPGNPYGPGAHERFVEVSVLISALSTGGVGLSDGLGQGNASLALLACGADGTLLQPSRPATPIDATFAAAGAPAGHVWQAPAFAAGSGAGSGGRPWWVTVLAIDVALPFALLPGHLTPPLQGPYVAAPWARGSAATAAACADGAPASACLANFSAAQPLPLLTGGEGSDTSKPHELLSLAPVLANGYALVGELDKAVRVSLQRFVAVAGDAPGHALPNLLVTLAGFPAPGGGEEAVAVSVLAPGGVMRSVALRLASAAPATFVCTGSGQASTCSVLQ